MICEKLKSLRNYLRIQWWTVILLIHVNDFGVGLGGNIFLKSFVVR